jgi:hypothetical protein
VEIADERQGREKRRFNLLFYMGADQAAGTGDAISRLDRFFNIKREPAATPGVSNQMLKAGYTKPVTLRIEGSIYKFSREDGQVVAVDVEKKTKP